ncbi:MAG: leucine-rich repeat domain-containing protein, partial [Phycisphaeraceae bacterium]|nr:leucine-rich repeat domain-containing protein [Phycisphaeraceae bacterium]
MLPTVKIRPTQLTDDTRHAKKNSLLFVICLIPFLTYSVIAGSDDPVNFTCENLKMAVEDELGVYDPTEEDMLWLTNLTYSECMDAGNIVDAEDCDKAITSLSGLEYAHNLRFIDFHLNNITSLSPLANLTKLRDVRVAHNHILDLGPLKDLTGLTYLDAHRNGLSDLSPLAGLTNLETLQLRFNNIRDLSPLSGLKSLEELHIYGNGLSDLSPLAGLDSLSTLFIYDNEISDLSPLAGMINLSHIGAQNNQISDLSPLAGLSNLRTLHLDENQISDILPLTWLTSLTRLKLRNNPLGPEACDIFPQIIANNPGIYFKHDPCLSQYGLIISSSSGGSVNTPGEGVFEYDNETSVSVTASAQSNNHFVNWTGTGAASGKIENTESPSITITVDGNYTLRANFAKDQSGSPSVSTYQAKNVGETSALLEAYLGDYGEKDCDGWFRYWLKGQQTQTEESTSKLHFLHESELYAMEVTSLLPGTTYHYQAVAENSYGLVGGNVREFTTLEDVIHVDDDAASDPAPYNPLVSDPREDGTRSHPYDSIQEAIEHARDLDKIVVHEGRYYETLNLMGKRLEIAGADPGVSDIAAFPVIDAKQAGTVVTFNHGENPECVLTGLVLTGGLHDTRGAIACIGTSPTIRNCLIVDNYSTGPAGAIIYGENSHSLFENITVHGNAGAGSGSAFRFTDSDALIVNSILWNHELREIRVASGHDPLVTYSDVQGTWPGLGNMDSDPLFASPRDLTDPDNPGSVFLAEDYHLLSGNGRWNPNSLTWETDKLASPCIDAGDPDYPASNEAVPNGKRINMGAYGGTAQASRSPMTALAHWTFDETSGSKTFDSLGNHHGIVYGAAWTDGVLDGALDFDGEDDYVDFGNSPDLVPRAMTMSLWVRPDALEGFVVHKSWTGAYDKDYELSLSTSGIKVAIGGVGEYTNLRSSTKVSANEWSHIAFSYGEGVFSVYINGALDASKTY